MAVFTRVAVSVLAAVPLATCVASRPALAAPPACPAIAGHMGAHEPYAGFPQDSLGAEAKAFQVGAAMVEMDVQFSRPQRGAPYGVPVVIHDGTVNSMTARKGSVASFTAAQLFRMRLRYLPGGRALSWQHIPSLAQVLAQARSAGRAVQVDIKPSAITAGEARSIASVFSAEHAWSFAVAASFTPAVLRELRAVDPRFTGRTELYAIHPAADTAGDVTEDIDISHLTADAVAMVHAEGMKAGTWTADSPAQWAAAAADGVDRITTDRPAGLATWEQAGNCG